MPASEQIQTDYPSTVAAAAVRVLALRKPAGAAETLLAFLPGPDEKSVMEEVQTALLEVVRIDGSLDPVFIASLTAAVPARRTAAALTLCKVGAVEHRPAVRKLLHDREASVRLAVAQALAIAGDKEAVPVLIELLAQVPLEQAGQAEELLYRLAGAKAPQVPLGKDPAAQLKCRDSWRTWWRVYGKRVVMTVLTDTERMLGYTLLVLLNDNCVVEWDREGKPRWQIDKLASPLDAEVLSGQRVLIAEHDTRRVHRAQSQGRGAVGEKTHGSHPSTLSVCRAASLHRHAKDAARSRPIRQGGCALSLRRGDHHGAAFRDGRIGCIENGGSYFELAATGRS